MRNDYLHEMPFTSGDLYLIKVTDGPIKTTGGKEYSEFVGVENEYNDIRAIGYVMNDVACFIAFSDLNGKRAYKDLTVEDGPMVLELTTAEIAEFSVSIDGDRYKNFIQRVVSYEGTNHSHYVD